MYRLKDCGSAAAWILDGKAAEAEVHSVFRRVLNLTMRGELVSLVSAELPWNPLSVRTKDVIDFTRLGINEENKKEWRVAAEAGKISVGEYEFYTGSDFAVFNARIPETPPERLRVIHRAAECVIAENADRGFARAICGGGQDADLVTRDLYAGYLGVREALRTGSGKSAGGLRAAQPGNACAALLGAGAGLTPSGDDFLCGMLQTLWAFGSVGRGWELLGAIVEAIRDKLYMTCDISRAYLRQSMRGSAGELTQGMLSAADERECREYMARMARAGHSSGIDMLCGIWTISDAIG